jgi:hypothetical protein
MRGGLHGHMLDMSGHAGGTLTIPISQEWALPGWPVRRNAFHDPDLVFVRKLFRLEVAPHCLVNLLRDMQVVMEAA